MKTILLFGGKSDERFVSIASAQNLIQHHSFEDLWFFSEKGEAFSVLPEELAQHQNPFVEAFRPRAKCFAKDWDSCLKLLQGKVAFLGFHGAEGENGTIQAVLEKAGLAFTGSGSTASHLCFEKTLAKQKINEAGILVAEEILVRDGATVIEFYRRHLKIVLKPVANGSSIGLFIIENESSLQQALDRILRENVSYMAEKFVQGRELTVGVVETQGRLKPLVASEVLLSAGQSFDYEGKYLGRGTTEVTPARLSTAEMENAQALALQAHRLLGCRGYSRTDMILSNGGLVFIETNTLPGLTKASFIPQQLHAAGISMSEFIKGQLEVASNSTVMGSKGPAKTL